MAKAAYVQWLLDGQGYRVTIYDAEGQPVEEYSAGDHPLDSQAVAMPGDKLSDMALRKFARQTAANMAAKHGVPSDQISHDQDGENEWRAILASRD